MRTRANPRIAKACVAAFYAAFFATFFATSCSFNPLNYMSRNACELFNCDELFFIEDLLPLSARPTGDAGAGGGVVMDMGEAEDEGGGHAH